MIQYRTSVPSPLLGAAALICTPLFCSVVSSGVPANGSGMTVV